MASWFSSIAFIAAHTLGIALLHTLWQGAILYILLRILLAVFRNSSAAFKYALSYTALGVVSIWFLYNCIGQIQLYNTSIHAMHSTGIRDWTRAYTVSNTTSTQSINSLLHSIENYLPLFWYIYIPGLLFMTIRLVLNIFSIHTYRTRGIISHQQTQLTLEQLLAKMNVTRKVKVYLSERVKVPVMMGAIRPFILLPVSILTQLSDVQLTAILMHELAHIKRYDYLLNLLQVAIETILFFNPFVWLINGIIRREREHCCDDMVVAYTQQPYYYATALAQLEQYRVAPAAALAASGNKNYLFTRIKRIIEMKKKPVTHHYIPGVVIVCIALLLPLFWFTPGFAQKVTDDGNSKKVKKVIIITDSSNVVKQYDVTPRIDADDEEAPEKAEIIKKKVQMATGKDSIAASIKVIVDAVTSQENMDKIKQAIAIAQKEIERSGNQIKDLDVYMKNDKNIKDLQKQMEKVDWDGIGTEIAAAVRDVQAEIVSDTSLQRLIRTIKSEVAENREITKIHSGEPYSAMLDRMQSDGLIDKNEGFEIEKSNNHLYINGDKQPKSVYNKYSHYLEASNIYLKGKKSRLKIDVRD